MSIDKKNFYQKHTMPVITTRVEENIDQVTDLIAAAFNNDPP